MESKSLQKAPTRDPEEADGDPGLIFVLWPPSKVHAALAFPSIQNITPSIQQGKKS